MRELREKMKAQAVTELLDMTNAASNALSKIAHGTPVGERELARLVVGGRVDSIKKSVLSRMVQAEADELLTLFNDQHELPLEARPDERPVESKAK